jgi:hypothetical protein
MFRPTPRQDWDEMLLAVLSVREFLDRFNSQKLELGTVVKTEDKLLGVIIGMMAPEVGNGEWSYLVLIPDCDDPPESESVWWDRPQLEVVNW